MAPSLAVAAPGGFSGAVFANVLAKAVEDGDLSSLVLLSTSPQSEKLKNIVQGSSGRVKWSQVDYSQSKSVAAALSGVDILVNCMGPDAILGGTVDLLTQGAAKANPPVKVYFPSEWGYDYDVNLPELANPIFELKTAHYERAKELGFKVVNVAVGSYTEGFLGELGPVFGKQGNVWNLPGDGNIPFAFTAMEDIARYVLRAGLKALEDPESVPERIRVYSDNRTWNEYADIVEKKSGEKITRVYSTQSELNTKYKQQMEEGNLYFILQAAAGTKAASFTESDSHVELLNPGQRYFKPISFEESLEKA